MWTLTFTVLDGKGKSGSFSLNFAASRTIAQIESWVAAASLALNRLIAGAVTAISITRSVDIPVGLAGAPADTSDIEEKMKVIAKTATGFYTSFAIPALAEDVVVTGSSQIDQSDALVIVLNNLIEVGDGGGTAPTTNRGEAISLITEESEIFASSVKQ